MHWYNTTLALMPSVLMFPLICGYSNLAPPSTPLPDIFCQWPLTARGEDDALRVFPITPRQPHQYRPFLFPGIQEYN